MVEPIGIIADDRLLRHNLPHSVRESPLRLIGLYQTLHFERERLNLRFIPPREAEIQELRSVHSEPHIEIIRQHCLNANPYSYDKDTYLMEESFYVASLAAGGCITLADSLMAGEISGAFAVVRPPGHHAETGRGRGFCIFNNIAVTAAHLKKRWGLSRIMILDFDAHHANGTQQIFFEDSDVLVISIHESNLFPSGSGLPNEMGRGEGTGFTVNLPVHMGFGDAEYSFLMGKVVQEITDQFRPQIILVSAGYDGHVDDPISSLRLTTAWYAEIVGIMRSFAEKHCGGRLMFVLEGGYIPRVLETTVISSILELNGPMPANPSFKYSDRAHKYLRNEIYPFISPHWYIDD